MLSSVLAGQSLVWVDAQVREGWPYIPTGQHWRWALLLYTAAGAAAGALGFVFAWLEARWSGERSAAQRAGFFAALGGCALAGTALSAFSGDAISATRWAQLGPVLALLLGALGSYVAAWLALSAQARAAGGDDGVALIAALGFGSLGLQLARLDLTELVALYPRLHNLLEACAWLALALGYAALLALAERRWPASGAALRAGGACGLVALLAVALSVQVRTRIEGALRHTFLEEVYVGRMLRRLQLVEAFAADPRGFRSLSWSRLQGLRKRSGFDQLRQDSRWVAPAVPLDAGQQSELWRLRDPLRRYNILVYYVDTLRADVAADRRTMPNASAFAAGAVRFPNAYSAGSDTLRALPALTGGDYDILSTPDNDVLRLARRAGYESTLLIPQSAEYFLAKLRPEFRFDRTLSIADHSSSRQVWGYGADQSTAARLVDRTLSFLDEPRAKRRPFLLWLFNFDVHNWRELENAHIEEAMRRFNIADDSNELPYRYRAAAAAVDAEFGRLLLGLEHRKLLDNTVILLVSDHGEALGRDGFWVHSVFLWESLVRVPLVLKAPGVPRREVAERVSLVDVAPTLARYMFPHSDLAGYAGEDLLTRLLEKPRPRRLPILLVSASRDVLVRVGVIAPARDYKLVLSLEAALPELYDLRASDADANNVADQHPELTQKLLRDLVASPVFPQSLRDFDVRDTRDQRAAVGIPADL
ncbi:MAG TPA: sulfatase-like hydrolase/transferase [Polyangiaceae bacterium]|nr:sulfatase-like hydrolase/transferase [Polyangiaceae bacterium]